MEAAEEDKYCWYCLLALYRVYRRTTVSSYLAHELIDI